MLLPSLQKAREKGRTAVCINNLKNIGYANQMYLDDHKDFFYHEKNGYDGRQYYERGSLNTETYGNYQVLYDRLYLNSKQTFMCPNYVGDDDAKNFSYSYAITVTYIIRPKARHSLKTRSVKWFRLIQTMSGFRIINPKEWMSDMMEI